jgi:16S rRNA (guanine527-N7)-methyltransferase
MILNVLFIMESRELLIKGLEEAGILCPMDRIDNFMVLLEELKKWNRTYNLSALTTDNDIVIKHFIDSLLYLKAVPDRPLRLADVGTGAGFPGIPIKIVRPEIEMTLIESSRKKAAFLRHMIRLIGLKGINVLEQRVEKIGKEYEGFFDIIVSRATFSIAEFLNKACPYINKKGLLVISKGPKVDEELKKDEGHSPVLRIHRLKLPFSDAERNLVVLQCDQSAKARKS